MVVLLKSEYVKTALTKSNVFTKSKFLQFINPLLGNGLVTAIGQQHQFQKKFFMKSFSMAQMKNYLPVFNKHAGILTEVIAFINFSGLCGFGRISIDFVLLKEAPVHSLFPK